MNFDNNDNKLLEYILQTTEKQSKPQENTTQ